MHRGVSLVVGIASEVKLASLSSGDKSTKPITQRETVWYAIHHISHDIFPGCIKGDGE